MRIRVLAPLVFLPLVAAPLAAQQSTFNRVEYWECPTENVEPLFAALDSIWAPLFDEMVEEGHFSSWLAQEPAGAREFEFVGGEESVAEAPPRWQFVLVTTAPSRQAMDAGWEALIDRLQSRFPDDPRPTLFCGDLMIVDYVTRDGS